MPLKPLATLQARLGAWADSRLLPAGVTVLLLLDVSIGLNWIGSSPRALSAPAYTVAKSILSMDAYGALFVAGALVTAVVYGVTGRSWWSGYLLGGGLAGMWLWWVVVFALAPIGTGGAASYAGTAFAGGICALHVLFGLALSYHPPRRADRG